jgi:hypothetical protein
LKQVHALIICCTIVMFAMPAFAQYSGNPRNDYGDSVIQPGKRVPIYHYNIGIYPLAAFDTAGVFGGRTGTQTLAAPLFTFEASTVTRNPRTRIDVGGWYWGKSDADLFEVHVRAVTRSGLGLQIGYLNNTKKTVLRQGFTSGLLTDANANDAFLIYEVRSPRTTALPVSRHQPWVVQFGAGLFIDYTPHLIGVPHPNQDISNATTGNYTFFVAGSIELAPRFNFQASEWIVRDRGEDLNRVAIGLGYSF